MILSFLFRVVAHRTTLGFVMKRPWSKANPPLALWATNISLASPTPAKGTITSVSEVSLVPLADFFAPLSSYLTVIS
jgi:hypothetical protein